MSFSVDSGLWEDSLTIKMCKVGQVNSLGWLVVVVVVLSPPNNDSQYVS
jgi:hypothetical protein